MANENEMNVSEVQESVVQDNPVVSDEPSNPISEGVTVGNDQSDDEVLDKIMGVLENEPDPSSLTETFSDVSQNQDSEPEVDTFPTDAETRSEPGEDYHRAMAALQRDGTPRELLDEYYEKDPDAFTQWGLKREKVQKDGDRFSDEHSKLRQTVEEVMRLQQQQGERGGQQPTRTQAPAASSQLPTPQNMLKHQQEIAEVFGDEAAESIMAPMRSVANMLANLYVNVAAQTGHTETQELARVRTELQERYPQLSDDGNFNSVIEKMQTLYRTGEYRNLNDLMTDAVRIRLADAAPPKTQQHAARSAGQPTTRTSNRRISNAPMSHDDREDAALDAIFNGGGLDGASEAYNS
tara:strand:- start:745 stop:1797 length:1053 start_codon:yes stop_codon:yes gene_type:complete